MNSTAVVLLKQLIHDQWSSILEVRQNFCAGSPVPIYN